MNYVFYVCDMADLPVSGHFRKMDAEGEIASHISRGLSDCIIKKYTEYGGEEIEAESVGIVFPTHMWGVSLAVFSFLQHIRIKKGTYIYAVAVGESLSGCVDITAIKRIKILEQFQRIFERKCHGGESDIFIRCIDRDRTTETTEQKMRRENGCAAGIKCIMEGLLFHDIDTLLKEKEQKDQRELPKENIPKHLPASPADVQRTERRLNNIYLDDEIFAGVNLCRVI